MPLALRNAYGKKKVCIITLLRHNVITDVCINVVKG